ncbi:MAG TPA: IS110 family transposase [Pyrinomonadaceae bacterium]|jgi:transposase|nr:IS110 family transposase [Pyrinomonadaceae bacterium]
MTEPALGIDISKLKFNACLINEGGKLKHKVFPNTSIGFTQLSQWLSKQGIQNVHACMEATGTYGDALSLFLYETGHIVSVVNPAAIKAFAQSRLSRTKTDRVDAELIARFCLAQAPPAWTPLPQEVRDLQALVRRLESLIEMRVAEENRLSSGITVDTVRQSVEEHLTYLGEQIKRTEDLIRSHINHHPGLKRQSQLLDSIPGIAETTAALLLSEITDINQYRSARQVAAYAGLVPRERQSGTSLRGRTRLSKIGNARLRRALYFPAITALRCSPFFQAWAEGLLKRGKSKMSVICAVMRKLVHLAYGVLKHGKEFDPQWAKTA